MSLAPVYKQLKNYDEDGVKLEDYPTDAHEDTVEVVDSADECNTSECAKDKKRKYGICYVIRKSFCVLFLLLTFAVLFGSIAMFSIGAVKVHRCMNPSYHELMEFTFNDDEVEHFDISAVAGIFRVRTCDKANSIKLIVDKASSRVELMPNIVVEEQLVDKTFNLKVSAPSFDLRTCQHADITLIVPTHLKDKKFKITAQTIVGSLEFSGDITYENIDAHTKIGTVQFKDAKAKNVLAKVDYGFLRIRSLKSKLFEFTSKISASCIERLRSEKAAILNDVGFGRVRKSLVGEFKVQAEFGYYNYEEIKSHQINAYVGYGAQSITIHPETIGKFKIASPYGYLHSDERGSNKSGMKLDRKVDSPAEISGNIISKLNGSHRPSDIIVMSQYGSVSISVPNRHPNTFNPL